LGLSFLLDRPPEDKIDGNQEEDQINYSVEKEKDGIGYIRLERLLAILIP